MREAVLNIRVWYYVCCLLFVFTVPANAQNLSAAIVLEDEPVHRSVAGNLAVLEDPTRMLDLAAVISAPHRDKFRQYEKIPQFSNTRSAYWASFSLRNNSAYPLTRILVLNYPSHQKMTLYMPDDEGGYRARPSHARRLVRDVDLAHRLPVYEVRIDPSETATYYWRIESPTVRPNIEIWDPLSFLERRVSEEWWYLVFLGVIAATWLYAAILMLASRERLYMALFFLTTTALVLQFSLQGHQYLLFGRYGGVFTVAYLLLQAWTTGAFLYFSVHLLGIEARRTRLRTGFRILCALFFVIGLWSLIDYQTSLKAQQISLLFATPALLGVSIWLAWKGSRDARLFLLAWSPLIAIVSLITLNGTDLIGNVSLGAYLRMIVIPTALLAFGFAILYRIIRERREKQRILSNVEMKSNFLATMSHEIRTP